jgi:hypothetical protein
MEGTTVVTSRLYVGHSDPTFIPKDPTTTPGLTVLNGPVIVGGQIDGQLPPPLSSSALLNIIKPAEVTSTLIPIPTKMIPGITAGLKISALGDGTVPYPGIGIMANAISHVISANIPIPPAAVGLNLLSSDIITITSPTMTVTANEIYVGNYVSTGSRSKTGAETQTGAKAETGAKAATGPRSESGNASQNATLNVASTIQSPTITRIDVLLASKKSFDIKHPTKENHRLRYICLEGPYAEVYFRGKLNGDTMIQFPEYWKNLVHLDSITINLTAVGFSQNLYVEKITPEYAIIGSDNPSQISCVFTVYGERKDVNKNIPEYEGQTSNDYPGNNNEYVVNGSVIN